MNTVSFEVVVLMCVEGGGWRGSVGVCGEGSVVSVGTVEALFISP